MKLLKSRILASFLSVASISAIILPMESVNAQERNFNWPTIEGRHVGTGMKTFRSLSKQQKRDAIARRFCQWKGYEEYSNWATVFRPWEQRQPRILLHEKYTDQVEWEWRKVKPGGKMFATITCVQSSTQSSQRFYNWPTIEGRHIGAGIKTFKSISKQEQREIAATRFCQWKGYKDHSNWVTVSLSWDQRKPRIRLHEIYTDQVEWEWRRQNEGGGMFASIACVN